MIRDDEFCFDSETDVIQRKWTQLLINWLNKCVSSYEVTNLTAMCLVEVINKYKEEICRDDIDKAVLCTDDVEPFITYKFPILRLRNLSDGEDYTKKLFIMTSVLLYWCIMNSKTGKVGDDICENMAEDEQNMILKFCEALKDMEVTINNAESSIKVACENQHSIENVDQGDSLTEPSTSVVTDATSKGNVIKTTILQFKSPLTILPSEVPEPSLSSFSEISDTQVAYSRFKSAIRDQEAIISHGTTDTVVMQGQCIRKDSKEGDMKKEDSPHLPKCLPDCNCNQCDSSMDPGCTKNMHDADVGKDLDKKKYIKWKFVGIICFGLLLVGVAILSSIPFWTKLDDRGLRTDENSLDDIIDGMYLSHEAPDWSWECRNDFCHKVFRPSTGNHVYTSLSRCTLLCMGPQLWPYPIGYTYFSKTLVALSTKKLEYKFQSVPSDSVHQYLGGAFKLFLKDLIRIEKVKLKSKNHTQDLTVKKMVIQIGVESDSDPRLRLNTEEAYTLKVETNNDQVLIKINSVSFCGVRHGLETLSQLILLDQSTGNLITLSNMIIKDGPSYKYRGLMIDTARNFIPVIDLVRTIDAMATCKLNTFHWRISDATSFPLQLKDLPEFSEYGPYDREMVYTREDIKSIVNRANLRGIRVLIEVAAPGPVGRPWSWSAEATCSSSNDSFSCNNNLCLRLNMHDNMFDILESIYSEILEITNVDDVFHLSDSGFSFANCYNLIDDREGFLDKALVRLKLANKGFLPKLPIIWYSEHLTRDVEAAAWDRLGVQLNDWPPNTSEQSLSKFKVIHSTKWDLSCEMRKQRCTKYRTWQQMYAWKSWRNVNAFTIEGGEAILWTDLVDSSNLDYHLWPRAAAVAERLWSDIVVNSSANRLVYVRLDTHRWRMLHRGVKVQPIWPAWCSFNPSSCLDKVHLK